jgi:hypothetical protein
LRICEFGPIFADPIMKHDVILRTGMRLLQFLLLPIIAGHIFAEIRGVEDERVEGVSLEPIFPHVLRDLVTDHLGQNHLQASFLEVFDQSFSCHQAPQKFRRTHPDLGDMVSPEDLYQFGGCLLDSGCAIDSDGRVVVDL